MSTTLLNAEIELSKQLGDFWTGTTTSAGVSGGTTLIDTALMAKANDWISEEAYDMVTSGTYDGQERKISSLDNSTGTITVLAHGGQIASGITYRVHRLFDASEKRRALIWATRNVFPACFQEVWDESLVSGNWLSDGSFERWTTSTNPTIWTDTTVTATQTTGAGYFRHGATSCKLSGSTGTLVQEWKAGTAEFDDLKYLRGKTATFTCQAWCNTASSLRLSVNDGTTQTYSSYHAGDSAWTRDDPRYNSFYVQQFIAWGATQVSFTIHFTTGATAYVDDARVISEPRGRLYIGHLGLAKNQPHQVYIERNYYSQDEDWVKIFGWKIDKDGYLYVPTKFLSDRRLRLRGIGYLDFLVSGASSTAWTATIALDQPQLDILVAEAILYLYTWMSMPNYETGTREEYQRMMTFWQQEVTRRRTKYGMNPVPATVNWGVS